MKAMLAKGIEDPRAIKSLISEGMHYWHWWAEPKHDGIRTLVHVDHGQVSWRNRSDEPLTKPIPGAVTRALAEVPGTFILDGELVDDYLIAFDCPLLGAPITSAPLLKRREVTEAIVDAASHPQLLVSERTYDKESMLNEGIDRRYEGIVLKDGESKYLPGMRTLSWKKVKFTRTIDCVVLDTGIDGKENAVLGVWDFDHWVKVGKCSTVGKLDVRKGDVLEVRFLYTGEGNRLVQPRMLRKRNDKSTTLCDIAQLEGTKSTDPIQARI